MNIAGSVTTSSSESSQRMDGQSIVTSPTTVDPAIVASCAWITAGVALEFFRTPLAPITRFETEIEWPFTSNVAAPPSPMISSFPSGKVASSPRISMALLPPYAPPGAIDPISVPPRHVPSPFKITGKTQLPM